MKNFKYITPETIEEASRLLKEPDAAAMGGGTDLLGVIKDELLPHLPETVVNLKKLPELSVSEIRQHWEAICARISAAGITAIRRFWEERSTAPERRDICAPP